MALGVGTRLGTYEIAGTLGVGGMGEVYRATDSELKRDVAIKVLPESLADDAERLARFRREAELLAALDEGRICGDLCRARRAPKNIGRGTRVRRSSPTTTRTVRGNGND